MESLECYVDECFENTVMGKKQTTAPTAMATPSSKYTHSECMASISTTAPDKRLIDILASIDKKLTSLDARLALGEVSPQ